MDINDAVDWYVIARKAQAEIERLNAELAAQHALCARLSLGLVDARKLIDLALADQRT